MRLAPGAGHQAALDRALARADALREQTPSPQQPPQQPPAEPAPGGGPPASPQWQGPGAGHWGSGAGSSSSGWGETPGVGPSGAGAAGWDAPPPPTASEPSDPDQNPSACQSIVFHRVPVKASFSGLDPTDVSIL